MLIASLVLALASLAPSPVLAPPPEDDPPVYGPCGYTDPDIWYVDPTIGVPGLDPACVQQFRMRRTANTMAYWIRIHEGCGPGDCACYKRAWDNFIDQMTLAELELMQCLQSGPSNN